MKKLIIKRTLVPTGCYLMKVHSNDEYFNDCNWLYVELTPALKFEIETAHALVLLSKKLLPESMYAIKLWCSNPYWLHDEEILNSENCDHRFPQRAIDPLNIDKDFVEVTKMSDEELGNVEEIRADACELIVIEGGYGFQCYVKNTNIHLYSTDMQISNSSITE